MSIVFWLETSNGVNGRRSLETFSLVDRVHQSEEKACRYNVAQVHNSSTVWRNGVSLVSLAAYR